MEEEVNQVINQMELVHMSNQLFREVRFVEIFFSILSLSMKTVQSEQISLFDLV